MNNKDCKGCIFEGWDCKDCYVDKDNSLENGESFNPSIVFTIVLTRQCNLRCNYCGIDFTDQEISYKTIDLFINSFVSKRKKINNIKIEFFGGEPLLEFEKIKYITEKTKNKNIQYSIVTNGLLLNDSIIKFLNKNNFEVVLSIARHTDKFITDNSELFLTNQLQNFIINFIIEPGKEKEMFTIFIKLIKLGFNKITILPVYYTKIWSNINFKELDFLLKKIGFFYNKINKFGKNTLELFYIRTNNESEFNVAKSDVELFIDFDGKIYGDYDTELRLLNDFVDDKVFKKEEILIGNLNSDKFDLLDIIIKRKKINVVKYINKISKHYKLGDNLKRLGEVINDNNVNKNDGMK